MRQLFILFIFLSPHLSYGQEDFNLELIANANYTEEGNDIWGYVSEDGIEYAIVGTVKNVRIYDLSNPSDPKLIKLIQGSNSTWRDIKSWQDHIYVTTGSGYDGLLVIDMSSLPDIKFQFIAPEINNESLRTCHNLYIDENGFMYLAGCNPKNANKAIIFDLNEDKWNPMLVGIHGGSEMEYAHDIMVQENVMYSSEIRKGLLVLYDVSDKADIKYLGETTTSFEATHNAWVSHDGKYVFTTDERANAFVDSYDLSDYSNIKKLEKFQPSETKNKSVVPHNTHYKDGFLITSWYTDGIVITDVSHPDNMVKVGAYDTWKGAHGGFEGCWGAYPYLPSGLILANDKVTGLYVLEPNYVSACHLEGLVLDDKNCQVINGVKITIIADQPNRATSIATGRYKTGIAESGKYKVRFEHPDYYEKEEEVELKNGALRILNTSMQSIEPDLSLIAPSSVEIYPNPANDVLHIDTDIVHLKSIEIFDVFGRKVYVTDAHGVIDVSNFASGAYLLRIEGYCSNILSRKVIIN